MLVLPIPLLIVLIKQFLFSCISQVWLYTKLMRIITMLMVLLLRWLMAWSILLSLIAINRYSILVDYSFKKNKTSSLWDWVSDEFIETLSLKSRSYKTPRIYCWFVSESKGLFSHYLSLHLEVNIWDSVTPNLVLLIADFKSIHCWVSFQNANGCIINFASFLGIFDHFQLTLFFYFSVESG